jgi:hypothetical protein
MDVTEAISRRKRGRISEHAFRRLIVSYPKWRLEFDGGERLVIRARGDASGEIRAGSEIFGLDLDDLTTIVVDPGTKHGFEIIRAEFPAYREMAEAIEIEAAWQRLARGVEQPDDLARVVHFSRYHVASVKKREGFLMIHVPHADGGMFVPIFTHRDALGIAMSDFRKNFSASEITTAEVSGERLFPPLAHENAEGIVLNYLGPPPPVAFRRGVLDVIFAALANHGPAA